MNKATGVPGLNRNDAYAKALYVPPLDEQRRIAAILDQADALRRMRREAAKTFSQLEEALFWEMFGDPVANNRKWSQKAIDDIGQVITGNTPSRSQPENYGAGLEWIKSDNLNNDSYFAEPATEHLSEKGRSLSREAPPGSILVTCIAGSPSCIGNSAMLDRAAAFNQQINALIPGIGDEHFLYAQIRLNKRLIQSASTNSMKGIVNKSRFGAIKLIFPPEQLQSLFAERASQIRCSNKDSEKSRCYLNTLFASLQHRAFHGEL